MMKKLITTLVLLAAMTVSAPALSEPASVGENIENEAQVLDFLNRAMPRTDWVKAQKLDSYPGFYAVRSKDGGDEGAMYFDSDKKILLIGLIVNMDLDSEAAQNQEIAPGYSN